MITSRTKRKNREGFLINQHIDSHPGSMIRSVLPVLELNPFTYSSSFGAGTLWTTPIEGVLVDCRLLRIGQI